MNLLWLPSAPIPSRPGDETSGRDCDFCRANFLSHASIHPISRPSIRPSTRCQRRYRVSVPHWIEFEWSSLLGARFNCPEHDWDCHNTHPRSRMTTQRKTRTTLIVCPFPSRSPLLSLSPSISLSLASLDTKPPSPPPSDCGWKEGFALAGHK